MIAEGPPVPSGKRGTRKPVIVRYTNPDKKITGYMIGTAKLDRKTKEHKYDDRRYFKVSEYTRVMREFADMVNADALELEAEQQARD